MTRVSGLTRDRAVRQGDVIRDRAESKRDVIPNRAESPVRNLLFASHSNDFHVES